MNKQHVMPSVFSGFIDDLFTNKPRRFFRDDFIQDEWMRRMQDVPVNVKETDDAFQIELAAPGLKKDNFKVQVKENTLTISFEQQEEKKDEGTKWLRREFSSRSFKRSFSQGEHVDTEKIKAQYEDGVLNIMLSKKEAAVAANKMIEIA